MLSILATEAAPVGGAFTIVWLIVLFALMYFMTIRPQQKEEKRKKAMLSELATGDTVLTTSGFYGTVIDITDDTCCKFRKHCFFSFFFFLLWSDCHKIHECK